MNVLFINIDVTNEMKVLKEKKKTERFTVTWHDGCWGVQEPEDFTLTHMVRFWGVGEYGKNSLKKYAWFLRSRRKWQDFSVTTHSWILESRSIWQDFTVRVHD